MRRLFCALLLFVMLGLARAGDDGVTTAKELVQAGTRLAAQGRTREALERFAAAQKADPRSGMPLAMAAGLLLSHAMDPTTPEADAASLKTRAEGYAREALRIEPANYIAADVLRDLADGSASPLRRPSPEALRLVREGGVLFTRHELPAAADKYREATAADPAYSPAYVFAGDCYYAMQRWDEAAALFRKAIEVEPLNAQAWRFLADTLARQRKPEEYEAALYGAIAAHPGEQGNWQRLASHMEAKATPLRLLQFVPKAHADVRDGAPKVIVGADWPQLDTADAAAWMLYAMTQALQRQEAASGKAAHTPYAIELHALNAMLDEIATMEKDGRKITMPLLTRLRALRDAGQLDAAVLLLMYREAYRPEFEAWKNAHPGGIRRFVESRLLAP